MKRSFAVLLTLALMMSLFAGCTQTNTPPTGESQGAGNEVSGQKFEIKLTSNDSLSTPWMQSMQTAADEVYEKTNGNVEIQIYGNGEMLVGDAGIDGVFSNSALFYFGDPCNWGDYIPSWNTICAAYLWNDWEEVKTYADSEYMESFLAAGEEKGVHVVGDAFYYVGTRSIIDEKPVYSLEDMKNITIRVPSVTLYTKSFDLLGANYQGMNMSEVFTAIETGILDGVEHTPYHLISNGIIDSMEHPYYSLTKHVVCIPVLCCGTGFWDTLPAEYQQIITEAFAHTIEESNEEVVELYDASIQEMIEQGVEIIEIEDLTPFAEAVLPYNQTLEGWDEIYAAVQELRAG